MLCPGCVKYKSVKLSGGGGGLLYIGIRDILGFFRVLFSRKINFWVYFVACNKFLGQIVTEH